MTGKPARFERLVNALDFAIGLRMVWGAVDMPDFEPAQYSSKTRAR
jgi:hypothetical protein